MTWSLERRGDVVVVTMRSNPVNKMNPAFFADCARALDALERDFPRLPMVLTAEGNTFSAGLDFADVFPRFARGDMEELGAWFDVFKGTIRRVFEMPRRTVAAINGNAFAGGLILALCCDVRVGVAGKGKFAINEVPVGIPMPSVYTEIVRYAVGSAVAAEAILSGRVYGADQALAKGFLHETVAADELIDQAVARAGLIAPDCFSAYSASKRILIGPTIERIDGAGAPLDRLAMEVVMYPDSVRAQAAARARLAKKS